MGGLDELEVWCVSRGLTNDCSVGVAIVSVCSEGNRTESPVCSVKKCRSRYLIVPYE